MKPFSKISISKPSNKHPPYGHFGWGKEKWVKRKGGEKRKVRGRKLGGKKVRFLSSIPLDLGEVSPSGWSNDHQIPSPPSPQESISCFRCIQRPSHNRWGLQACGSQQLWGGRCIQQKQEIIFPSPWLNPTTSSLFPP